MLRVNHFRCTEGAFDWDQSGIRIIGIMRVSICLGAILIPEYLDFYSGYSAPKSRISGIYQEYIYISEYIKLKGAWNQAFIDFWKILR